MYIHGREQYYPYLVTMFINLLSGVPYFSFLYKSFLEHCK